MNPIQRLFQASLISVAALLVVGVLSADEWKPRHDLVSHNGILNLPEPPPPSEVFFSGPASPYDQPAWLAGLKAWRQNALTLLRYSPSEYERPDLEWTQHVFSQVQLLVWDRSFYDPDTARYTVDRFLTDTESRIGPIDAVLIWHVYPNLGVDDRNQFDMMRDLPGGIAGLHSMVEQFHKHGVKVFFPILAWDAGTRDEGSPSWTTMSNLLKEIDADGINFDTLETVPPQFRQASDASEHPLALEPQFQPRDESISWTNISWNDWVTWEGKPYPFVPMVSKNKWMEPRHAVNVTDRFTRDKTDSLQHAFFNGQGYATLENLWGFWYGNTPHDDEAILRLTRIERAMADYLLSPDWEPHAPVLQDGVFASRFPLSNGTLWTIVNRNEYSVSGPQISVLRRAGMHYYDLWHGTELTPSQAGEAASLSFEIEGLGFGAVLATEGDRPHGPLREQMQFMAARSRRSLESYPRTWEPVRQTVVEIPPTRFLASVPLNVATTK